MMNRFINVSLLALFMLINLPHGISQILYFQINKEEKKPELTNSTLRFQQPEIRTALKAYQVDEVLSNADRYHSKYAEELSRTYSVDLSALTVLEARTLKSDLESLSIINYVERIEPAEPLSCPTNDDHSWGISRHEITCVQEAHCITQGDPSIGIAIFDSGYEANHPELAGQILYLEPGADNGSCHGTQSAITAAGATDNGIEISSSGYDCSLLLYRGTHLFDLIDAVERGARVVNNSWKSCDFSNTEQTCINLATEMGTIIVGSAANGNTGNSCNTHDFSYPASYDNVISVSSVSPSLCVETQYDFWNPDVPYDPPLVHTHNTAVDVLCQGFFVRTGTCSSNNNSVSYGTSIAGPHIAGIIGLMLSVNPCLNHDEIHYILQSTGQDVSNVCNNQDYYPNSPVPPVPCAESAVLMAQNYVGPDLVIDTDTDWDQKFVSGNVIIQSGATLTINGIASMGKNAKIIVERNGSLVIDGGTLTSCSDQWRGVVVEGDAASGNQLLAGSVRLINGAIIENAKTAISMNPKHIPWPNLQNYWGGLVTAEDATFRNCNRAVEFMRYGTGIVKDESSFTNCTFESLKTAITIWADNGIKIDKCSFNNIFEYAIHPYNSEVFVENGCTFDNMPIGLNILYTYPQPFAPQIGNAFSNPNDFSCSEYGIHATSAGSTDALNVENNIFLGGPVGVHLNGESYFEIHHNDFINHTGILVDETSAIAVISTGFNDNGIFENNIGSSLYGSQAIWENSGLRYAFNCFDFNVNMDILITEGSIHPYQEGDRYETNGDEFSEAGNCFSKGGVPEIDNTGNAPINYYVLSNIQPGHCKYLDNSINVNQEDGVPADLMAACGAVNSPGNINVVSFCGGPFSSKSEIEDKIESVEAYIAQIESTTYPSEAYKKYLLAKYERCLKRLLAQIGIVIMDEPTGGPTSDPDGTIRMEEFITYYEARPEFEYQIMAYGMMVELNDLTRARTYLNNLVADTEEKQDFVWAQHINLDYLDNPSAYVLDGNDEIALYDIAQKSYTLAGFARSIYEVLTERKVDLKLPDRSRSALTGTEQQVESLSINSFPNPVKDIYSIILSGADNDLTFQTLLMDNTGRVVKKSILKNAVKTDLDLNTLYDGIYHLNVIDESGKIIYSTKVVKIH